MLPPYPSMGEALPTGMGRGGWSRRARKAGPLGSVGATGVCCPAHRELKTGLLRAGKGFPKSFPVLSPACGTASAWEPRKEEENRSPGPHPHKCMLPLLMLGSWTGSDFPLPLVKMAVESYDNKACLSLTLIKMAPAQVVMCFFFPRDMKQIISSIQK